MSRVDLPKSKQGQSLRFNHGGIYYILDMGYTITYIHVWELGPVGKYIVRGPIRDAVYMWATNDIDIPLQDYIDKMFGDPNDKGM